MADVSTTSASPAPAASAPGATPAPQPVAPPAPAAPAAPAMPITRSPVKLSRPMAAAARPMLKSTLPQGWWKVNGIKGLKADIAKAISGMPEIPPHWQAALQAEIGAHPAPAVMVHAHFSRENRKTINEAGVPGTTPGKLLLHLDISPLDNFIAPGS